MVMGWAARLGLFLFARILHDGEDKRFVRAKEEPSLFFKFWIIQGISTSTYPYQYLIAYSYTYDSRTTYFLFQFLICRCMGICHNAPNFDVEF